MDSSFFSGFTSDLHSPSLWSSFYSSKHPNQKIPPLPNINGEDIFWKMMDKSRDFDPWMYPALKKLKESKKFVLAALSNTVIFPEGHKYANPEPESDVRRSFDVFVSSAHVGLRKPSPEIYALTLKMLNDHSPSQNIQPQDIVFLDDIGENLKAAKKAGFRTIKVNLGRTFEAVDQLEEVTGMSLAGNHPRVPVLPVVRGKSEAKL